LSKECNTMICCVRNLICCAKLDNIWIAMYFSDATQCAYAIRLQTLCLFLSLYPLSLSVSIESFYISSPSTDLPAFFVVNNTPLLPPSFPPSLPPYLILSYARTHLFSPPPPPTRCPLSSPSPFRSVLLWEPRSGSKHTDYFFFPWVFFSNSTMGWLQLVGSLKL